MINAASPDAVVPNVASDDDIRRTACVIAAIESSGRVGAAGPPAAR